MVQQASERFRQAVARTEETKQFMSDIKHITCRKFTTEEKIH